MKEDRETDPKQFFVQIRHFCLLSVTALAKILHLKTRLHQLSPALGLSQAHFSPYHVFKFKFNVISLRVTLSSPIMVLASHEQKERDKFCDVVGKTEDSTLGKHPRTVSGINYTEKISQKATTEC